MAFASEAIAAEGILAGYHLEPDPPILAPTNRRGKGLPDEALAHWINDRSLAESPEGTLVNLLPLVYLVFRSVAGSRVLA